MGNDLSGKRPSAGSAKNQNFGQVFLDALTHTSNKIPLAARTDPDRYLPPGILEVTVPIVHWPLEGMVLDDDVVVAFGTHGEYVVLSVTQTMLEISQSGNIFADAVDHLQRDEYYVNHPIEFIKRLNVINTKGQLLFEITNETLGVIPSRWTWREVQGGR